MYIIGEIGCEIYKNSLYCLEVIVSKSKTILKKLFLKKDKLRNNYLLKYLQLNNKI